MHQDGLHPGTAREFPEPLGGVALVGDRPGDLGERRGEFLGQAGAERGGQGRELRELLSLAVEAVPELVDPVPRLRGEEVAEGRPVGVVLRAHVVPAAAAPAAYPPSEWWRVKPSRR